MLILCLLLCVDLVLQFLELCVLFAIFGVMNGKKREEYR